MDDDIGQKLQSMNLSGCSQNLTVKQNMVYKNLNDYQKTAYNDINKLLKESKDKVILIDAPSGSGKTYLLCTLATNYDAAVKFVVFRKDQASQIAKLKNVNAYTYISFNMHHFNLSYKLAIQMFRQHITNNIKELYWLIVYSKKFVTFDKEGSVMIVDAYTIPSPVMLLLLYIVSIKNHMHLIFAGNKMQLNAICKSTLHNESNFYIIQLFADLTINRLSENMRTYDSVLDYKILQFREKLLNCKSAGDVKFNFDLRYLLYTLFEDKYNADERFDTLYIAQKHIDITARLHRFVLYLNSIGMSYVQSPFHYEHQQRWYSLPVNVRAKFFPYLLLVEGYKYIYVDVKGVHDVVILKQIIFDSDCQPLPPCSLEPTTLLVQSVNNNCTMKIERCVLNYYQILPAYRNWLLRDVGLNANLSQFPLRPYVLTYHATLGRTIEKEAVELCTDCTHANFMYVGISCVREYSAIHKIHDKQNLPDYVLTHYMAKKQNDNRYYYRFPTKDPNRDEILKHISSGTVINYIDNIQWKDVKDVSQFERQKLGSYIRIERSAYNHTNKETTTPLMQIVKFVRDNPNVIREVIKNAPVEDFRIFNNNMNNDNNNNAKNKNGNKQQQKKQYTESKAYVYLKDKYAEWFDANEKSE
ncbi:hypothetical protein WH47_02338 [Habropoda laboriosa]|uniref:Helicase/UvrB N-terminal domain-containing protein n=1 Tax=Habropoda laboriosa TaxID=597456 RepID=A0A0L7QZN7_9HYME|nr:PREDICTED: uncharacterized protein LOC108573576 [Habropoda laboriosa]KOC64017.1 hypothetical protein WH47_02338 [Habropoda laboriosa]